MGQSHTAEWFWARVDQGEPVDCWLQLDHLRFAVRTLQRRTPRRPTARGGHPLSGSNVALVDTGRGRRGRRCLTCRSMRKVGGA